VTANQSSDDAVYRFDLAYDGRAYFGWQRHGSKPTVQAAVEDAVNKVFDVHRALHGSGRTDRGVHAEGQVASMHLPPIPDTAKAKLEIAALLPDDIQLLAFERAADDFHARTSAKSKTYRYVIYNAPECPKDDVGRVWHIPGRLDVKAMREACSVFVGRHDFASFAKKTNFEQASTVREVYALEFLEPGTDDSRIEITISADGFLWKMVRNIMRALVKVGEGRSSREKLAQILAAKDRAAAPGTAPASGLYLDRVVYE
jgi:tRNA pseudouridine38-40 synthase